MDVKFPNVEVRLSNKDSNAFFILGRVRGALRKAGVSEVDINAFTKEATAGDYDHLLQTVMKTVDVE